MGTNSFMDKARKIFLNKDFDGQNASNSNRITLPKASTSELDSLQRKEATVAYDTDQQSIVVDDGTGFVPVGGGGSGAATDLSNLTAPTLINQDLLPDASYTRNIGTHDTKIWNTITVDTANVDHILNTSASVGGSLYVGQDTLVSNANSTFKVQSEDRPGSTQNVTLSSGQSFSGAGTGNVSVYSPDTNGPTGSVSVYTGTAQNSIAGSISIHAGGSTDSGEPGSINITTGTNPDSGSYGSINISTGGSLTFTSEGVSAVSGYYWNAVDGSGRGHWIPNNVSASRIVTGDYFITEFTDKKIILNGASGAKVLTLPLQSNGMCFDIGIANANASTWTFTVSDGSLDAAVSAALTYMVTNKHSSISVVSQGSVWYLG